MFDEKLLKRFWAKVDKRGLNQCWEWSAGRLSNGYGAFRITGVSQSAHRASWMIHNGEIPEGMLVCHHCDNRTCINPDHLFLGTAQDNLDDMTAKNRRAKGERIGTSKLKQSEVDGIRNLYNSTNTTMVELGIKYSVHYTNVSMIINNKSWVDQDYTRTRRTA